MTRLASVCCVGAVALAAMAGCSSGGDKPSPAPSHSTAPDHRPDNKQLHIAERTLTAGPAQSSGSEIVADGVHVEDDSLHSGRRLELELACVGTGRLTIAVHSGDQHANRAGSCAATPARITVPFTAAKSMRLDVSGAGSGVIAWKIRQH